jgi:hypothetical protein
MALVLWRVCLLAQARFAPRHLAPYVISGASGAHIFARLWRLSRAPARKAPLHLFLARHSDVMLVLCSSHVVVWRLAKRYHQDNAITNDQHPDKMTPTAQHDTVHQLRQVFTALLLGLGMRLRADSPPIRLRQSPILCSNYEPSSLKVSIWSMH